MGNYDRWSQNLKWCVNLRGSTGSMNKNPKETKRLHVNCARRKARKRRWHLGRDKLFQNNSHTRRRENRMSIRLCVLLVKELSFEALCSCTATQNAKDTVEQLKYIPAHINTPFAANWRRMTQCDRDVSTHISAKKEGTEESNIGETKAMLKTENRIFPIIG